MKEQYLLENQDFIDYVAEVISGDRTIDHAIYVRDNRIPPTHGRGLMELPTLGSAFKNYWWNGEDYVANAAKLNRIQGTIREAINDQGNNDKMLKALQDVLEWGAGGTRIRLYTSNVAWAEDPRIMPDLWARMQAGCQEMESVNPNIQVFTSKARMNAGFTKFYSLACRNVIIYDGRVGAAMGFMVRKYCNYKNYNSVPKSLGFQWGAQNGGQNKKRRDPSSGDLIFRQLLAGGGSTWALWNIRANWVLGAALQKALERKKHSEQAWYEGKDALRKVEAALFIVGYDLSCDVQAQ